MFEHLISSSSNLTAVVPRKSCYTVVNFAFLTLDDPKESLYGRQYNCPITVLASEMSQQCPAVFVEFGLGRIAERVDVKDVSPIVR